MNKDVISDALAIKCLSQETSRAIFSGHSITSIYSAVKELLENSLDANPTTVEVKLLDFGLKNITVTDNGCGMREEELKVMAKPHFTSKISHYEDLFNLKTYGFRGEALGALCTASQMTITSRCNSMEHSITCTFDKEGNTISRRQSSFGKGTIVSVENLFANYPVRRQCYKSMKRKKEELTKIELLIKHFSVLHPGVRMALYHCNALIFQKPVVPDIKSALLHVWGVKVYSLMDYSSLFDEDSQIKVSAYLPKKAFNTSEASKSTSDGIFLSVNRRPARIKDMVKLIHQFYVEANNMQDQKRPGFPLAYISVELPLSQVDVNLEPEKFEMHINGHGLIISLATRLFSDFYSHNKSSQELTNEDCQESVNDLNQEKTLESLQEGEPSHEKDNEKKQHWGKNNIKERANGNFKNEIYSGNQDITICSHDFSQEPNGHSSEVIDSKECNDDFYEFELLTDTRHCSNSLRKGDQKEVCVSVTEKGMSTTGIGICDTINYEQNPPKALNTSWDIIHDELDTPDDDRLSNCSKLTELIDEIFSENETDSEENPNQAACLNLEKESLHDFDSSRNLNQELNITSIAYKPMSNPSNYLPQSENFRNRQLGIGKSISSSNSGSERSLSTVTDFWSRGNALESRNGEKIQPVKIVLPEKRSNKRLSMSSSSESTPKSKKRIITVPHNQPKISSAICMKVTPKAITPYSVFIQENKEKILLENPDYNTDRINDVLLGKWKELTEKGREYYVKECMKLKYNNINVNDIDDSLEETEINYSTSLKSQKVEDVNFSIHDLKTSISKNNCKVQSGIKGKITLIGEKENLWFGLFENREIVLINILKLHQVTLYNNLCASFKLSLVVLRNSIPLEFLSNEKFISLGKVVRMLSAEEHGRLDPYKYIIDPRLTWNGFFVRHFETTDEFRAEIWQMSQTMPTYGVTDLIEILQHIEKDNNIELRESRPLKLLAYLQEEALRISKNMPKRVTHEHLQEMLSSFDETSHFISSQKNLDRSIVHRISVVS